MQKIFIIAGVLLIIIGLGWPWLSKIPIGRLPGDIFIDRPGLKIYFPVTTMVIVSIAISLVLWLLRK